jgi:hypothetical protein
MWMMLKWTAHGLLIISLVACGQFPQSFQNNDNQSNSSRAYTMTVDGKEVVWAYAAEPGPLNGPVMADGLLLENLTPDKRLDDEAAKLVLLRAVNGSINRGSEAVTFLDAHPDDKNVALSYQLNEQQPMSAVALRNNRYKLYLNLYKAPPSYRNAQGVGSTIIPIGTLTMMVGRTRAYVSPDASIQIASISQGAGAGSWGIKMLNNLSANAPAQPAKATEWCDTTTVQAGTLTNQSPFDNKFICRPRPSEFDVCNDASRIEGCIGYAPIESANAFTNVGQLDTTFLRAYNSERRMFLVNPQSPYEVKIAATFIAKTITATEQNNALQCRDQFRAIGLTIGARINEHCVLTPDPSPHPIEGRLACKVTLQFVHDQTFQDKNCYVSGIFNGEEEFTEQFLIYRE